jgi:hypothetical protein
VICASLGYSVINYYLVISRYRVIRGKTGDTCSTYQSGLYQPYLEGLIESIITEY